MPDPLFDGLFDATGRLSWPATADVERRGRQRRRRQALSAAAATIVLTVAVTGGVVVMAGQGGAPSPPAAPPAVPSTTPPGPPAIRSPAPSATVPTTGTAGPSRAPAPATSPDAGPAQPAGPAIPVAALLTTSDVGRGFRIVEPVDDGDRNLHSAMLMCENPRRDAFAGRIATRQRAFRAGGRQVDEKVERYKGAGARRQMAYVRSWVTGCVPIGEQYDVSVVDEGFAGDESLLVKASSDDSAYVWAVVRQGDLVAEIGPGSTSLAEARRLAVRAATRLCAGTDAC